MLVVWLASGFYIVDASQRGVVLRFGKFNAITESGPRWHLPWPIESAEVVNVTGVRTIEIGYRNNVKSKVQNESLMLTDDENIIDIQFAVQYILKDPTDYLFNNRDADKSVMQASESAIREVVGKNKMDFLLYGRQGKDRRNGADPDAENSRPLQDRHHHDAVTMQDAQAPEEVQAAFDDAVKAGQDRERQINEGQSYFNDVVPKAKGTSARLIQEGGRLPAERDRQRRGRGVALQPDRHGIQQGAGSDPPTALPRCIAAGLVNSSKVVVDQKAGSNLLYLPLDKLMQLSAGATPPVDPASKQAPTETVVPAPAPTESSPRSRDAFRSRDREAR